MKRRSAAVTTGVGATIATLGFFGLTLLVNLLLRGGRRRLVAETCHLLDEPAGP